MKEEYQRLERTLIHKGSIIEYYQDTMLIGGKNKETWDFIAHQGAAAAFPVRGDGKILMVRQYRPALERETLEIPAGGLNGPNEPTDLAAARELLEETGYRAGHVEKLLTVRTTVAFCNEKIDIYLCSDLAFEQQHLDESEFINVEAYELDELVKMVHDGILEDSKTVAAIMTYKDLVCGK